MLSRPLCLRLFVVFPFFLEGRAEHFLSLFFFRFVVVKPARISALIRAYNFHWIIVKASTRNEKKSDFAFNVDAMLRIMSIDLVCELVVKRQQQPNLSSMSSMCRTKMANSSNFSAKTHRRQAMRTDCNMRRLNYAPIYCIQWNFS